MVRVAKVRVLGFDVADAGVDLLMLAIAGAVFGAAFMLAASKVSEYMPLNVKQQ